MYVKLSTNRILGKKAERKRKAVFVKIVTCGIELGKSGGNYKHTIPIRMVYNSSLSAAEKYY